MKVERYIRFLSLLVEVDKVFRVSFIMRKSDGFEIKVEKR